MIKLCVFQYPWFSQPGKILTRHTFYNTNCNLEGVCAEFQKQEFVFLLAVVALASVCLFYFEEVWLPFRNSKGTCIVMENWIGWFNRLLKQSSFHKEAQIKFYSIVKERCNNHCAFVYKWPNIYLTECNSIADNSNGKRKIHVICSVCDSPAAINPVLSMTSVLTVEWKRHEIFIIGTSTHHFFINLLSFSIHVISVIFCCLICLSSQAESNLVSWEVPLK